MRPNKKLAWIRVTQRTGLVTYINIAHITDFYMSHGMTYINIVNRDSPIIVAGDITKKLTDILVKSVTYSLFIIPEEKKSV